MTIQEAKDLNNFLFKKLIGSLMTYEITCLEYDEHENNLPKNKKDLTLRTKEDHSNESSSDDDFELLISKFKRFIKQ